MYTSSSEIKMLPYVCGLYHIYSSVRYLMVLGSRVTLKEKRTAVNASESKKRLLEEKVILLKEMHNHVQHLKTKKASLLAKRSELKGMHFTNSQNTKDHYLGCYEGS